MKGSSVCDMVIGSLTGFILIFSSIFSFRVLVGCVLLDFVDPPPHKLGLLQTQNIQSLLDQHRKLIF